MPFPKVEENDPKAACKIAWNFTFAGSGAGGGGATFTLNGIDSGGEFRRIKAFVHTMGYQGRLDGKLKDNPENLEGQGVTGALEPQDVEGFSALTKRYWDWDSQAAIWASVPQTRRPRRLNRAGEYFYTAACGYHFVKNDDTFSAVFPSLVIGVHDKINRAAIGGRYQSSFIERNWDPSYFSLRTLTHMSD